MVFENAELRGKSKGLHRGRMDNTFHCGGSVKPSKGFALRGKLAIFLSLFFYLFPSINLTQICSTLPWSIKVKVEALDAISDNHTTQGKEC